MIVNVVIMKLSLNDFDDISIDSDDPYNCEFNLPVDQYFLSFIGIITY